MLKYLLLGAVILCALVLLISYICYRKVFAVTKKAAFDSFIFPNDDQYGPYREITFRCIERVMALPFEDVYVTSFDGLKLHGRYYETKKGAPTQILFHGYQSSPFRDFSGGLLLALKTGYNAILVDQRAHGESEGKCLSFGVLERFDCLSWAKFASETYGGDIILTGISMGGATVLMASNLELPENVKGIISDCAYSSPKEIIQEVMRADHYPIPIIYPFVVLGGKIFGGFNLEESSAFSSVKNTKVPILLVHGEEDRFVPCYMSKKIYSSNKEKITLETFPGAGHGLSYSTDGKRFEKVFADFLKKCLGERND